MRTTTIITTMVLVLGGCGVDPMKFAQAVDASAIKDAAVDGQADAPADAPPDAPMGCGSDADCASPGPCEMGPGACTNHVCVYTK